MPTRLSRRHFLQSSAALAGVGYLSCRAAAAPGDKLNIAVIGVAGRGGDNMNACAATENIVALCDVDENNLNKAGARFPSAKKFFDFREMLADPKGTEQTENHYRIAKGLKLRDEIARDFKIALNLWQDFQALRQRQDVRAHEVTVREWLLPLLRDVLHFHDAARCAAIEKAGHQYAVGHAGNGGRVPPAMV